MARTKRAFSVSKAKSRASERLIMDIFRTAYRNNRKLIKELAKV